MALEHVFTLVSRFSPANQFHPLSRLSCRDPTTCSITLVTGTYVGALFLTRQLVKLGIKVVSSRNTADKLYKYLWWRMTFWRRSQGTDHAMRDKWYRQTVLWYARNSRFLNLGLLLYTGLFSKQMHAGLDLCILPKAVVLRSTKTNGSYRSVTWYHLLT
jgi:hypothetical protein